MIIVYCKTSDSSKKVGEIICCANSSEKGLEWKIKDEVEEDSWTIQTSCDRFAHALVYRVGASVVAVEVEVDCAQNVIEPLIKKYGFENLKWLTNIKEET